MADYSHTYEGNADIAKDMTDRRGRTLRGRREIVDERPFTHGEQACARCGVVEQAPEMVTAAEGLVCERCFLLEDARPPNASVSWWLRAAAASGSAVVAVVVLVAQVVVFGVGAAEGVAALAWGFALFGGVFAVLAVATGIPLLRAARLDPDLSGLSHAAGRGVAVTGLAAVALGGLALLADAVLLLVVL